MDRRFGEKDPHLTPEQKSLQRFVRERETAGRKASMFDLEEPIDDEFLTHHGQSLQPSVPEDEPNQNGRQHVNTANGTFEIGAKRRRLSPPESESDQENELVYDPNSEHKSRKEAMEEVIARSKLQKYERQKEKEDDDDLRAELDKGLLDIFSALRNNHSKEQVMSRKPEPKPSAPVNADRQALIEGKDRRQADNEYDERLHQMVIEQRARPAMPTITEEEKLQRQAQKVKELEEERLRRMQGDQEKQESENNDNEDLLDAVMDFDKGSESTFGLGDGLLTKPDQITLSVEDEDVFVIDDNVETDDYDTESHLSHNGEGKSTDDEDLQDSLTGLSVDEEEDTNLSALKQTSLDRPSEVVLQEPKGCPSSLEQFLRMTKNIDADQVPLIIQRLRALYHPRLGSENKAKLATFAPVLVEYLYYSTIHPMQFKSSASEGLIRHVHSLAKMFPTEVGNAFRSHLRQLGENRPISLDAGDLMILTAIGSIFPTSDHFHPVVTPAMLCMTRYLSQSLPDGLLDVAIGTFVSTICLQYQNLARRHVAEVINYIYQAFQALLPTETGHVQKQIPNRTFPENVRMKIPIPGDKQVSESLVLAFGSILSPPASETEQKMLKSALLFALIRLMDVTIDLYQTKSSFCEVLAPVYRLLANVCQAPEAGELSDTIKSKAEEVASRLRSCLMESLDSREALALHRHRPLPIKTSLPKFDESFNPDKHNDPDADRAELSKLKAQHKKEKKGALRELRKDAKFMAREDLREKKEKDAAYEKKFKRLVAEIQGEEGHESKVYEREKRKRLGKK